VNGNADGQSGKPLVGGTATTVWRDDPAYETTRLRMVWNERRPDRYPDVIVTAASDADVIAAVRLGRAQGLRIAVRSGGHSWCASSLRDGGMLIDLSRLKGVEIDAAARTAVVQPSIQNRELMAALVPHGLAFPAGHCPTVGLGGFLLSGGQGWNQGGWGPACESVLAIDLVNAAGELITVDAAHDAALFWAARGGGAGFPGVIVRYRLQLYPLPKAIASCTYVYPLDQLEAIIPWLAQTAPRLSSNVEQLLLMAPPHPSIAAALDDPGRRYLTLWPTAFGDSLEETAAALAPLDACPVRDRALLRQFNVPVTFEDLFDVEAAVFPVGHRYDVEIIWSDADPLAVLPALRDRLAQAPSPKAEVLVAVTGPSTIDPRAREMAYSLAAPLYIGCFTMWDDAADDEANVRWHRETVQSLQPITSGHYIGETDLTASPTRAAHCFGPGVWERVRAVQRQYDPDGVFHTHIGQA
jgi:FAD/FMN-containing dehydrogenase